MRSHRFPSSSSGLAISPFLAMRDKMPKNGGDFSGQHAGHDESPEGVILVKGPWSSASDSVTPVPEGGSVTNNVFRDQYFGMTLRSASRIGPRNTKDRRRRKRSLRAGADPPADTYKGPARGNILITAQDMFFTPLPQPMLSNSSITRRTICSRLQSGTAAYEIKIAAVLYFLCLLVSGSRAALVCLATEIRCHAVEIVLTSRDTKLLESLMLGHEQDGVARGS
jgi:hypothetical protein